MMSMNHGIAPGRAVGHGNQRWSDAGVWTGDGLRREVFFFDSGGPRLYGSLYSAAEPSRPFGVVACGSWGVEADRSDPLLRSVALAMARLGGAALVFHYPGYGDSFGDLADLDLADLERAAVAAVAEAGRRIPGIEWILAGFMFGASVACLARRRALVETLLLVQPELRPGAYVRRLAERRRRLAPGPSPREMMKVGTAPDMAYGYPVPQRIAERADEADEAVGLALRGFAGDGSVVHHVTADALPPMPPRIEQINVPGTWRFGSENHPALAAAAAEWLERRTGRERE